MRWKRGEKGAGVLPPAPGGAGTERPTPDSAAAVEALARALAAAPGLELGVVSLIDPNNAEIAGFIARRRVLVVIRALGDAGVDVSRLRPEVREAVPTGDADVSPEDTDRVLLVTR